MISLKLPARRYTTLVFVLTPILALVVLLFRTPVPATIHWSFRKLAAQKEVQSCDRCSASPAWCEQFGSRNMDLVQAYEGSGDRVRRVLTKAARGEPIHFGILGGSMSLGHGCACSPFHRQVFDWWNTTFPHAENKYINGAVGARGTNYFKFCASEHLPASPHLVLLEHSLNDRPQLEDAGNMEAILRHILALPSQPAVILTASFSLMPSNKIAMGGDVHLPVAQYYDVPVINLRHALFPVMLNRPEMVDEFFVIKSQKPNYVDLLHLSGRGHEALAQSTIAYLERQRCLLANPPLFHAPSEWYDAAAPSLQDSPSSVLDGPLSTDDLPRLSLLSSTWSPDSHVPAERPSCASIDSSLHPLVPLNTTTPGWMRWTQPHTTKTYWRAESAGERADFPVEVVRGEVMVYILKSNRLGLGWARCWLDDDKNAAVLLDGYWSNDQSIGWHYPVAQGVTPGLHTLHCEVLERDTRPDAGRGTAFLIIAVLAL